MSEKSSSYCCIVAIFIQQLPRGGSRFSCGNGSATGLLVVGLLAMQRQALHNDCNSRPAYLSDIFVRQPVNRFR